MHLTHVDVAAAQHRRRGNWIVLSADHEASIHWEPDGRMKMPGRRHRFWTLTSEFCLHASAVVVSPDLYVLHRALLSVTPGATAHGAGER
jgi:hypothetical protein